MDRNPIDTPEQTTSQLFAWSESPSLQRDLGDMVLDAILLALATALGTIFEAIGMHTCVVIIYVVAVQVIALVTIRRFHCLLSSVVAVLLYNFFFAVPRFSMTVWGKSTPATMTFMFIAAIITSYAALALRHEVHKSNEAVRRSRMMLETDRELQRCENTGSILRVACTQAAKLVDRPVLWYQARPDDDDLVADRGFDTDGTSYEPQEIAPEMPPMLGGSAYVGAPLDQSFGASSQHGIFLTVYGNNAAVEHTSAPSVFGVMAICADEDDITDGDRNALTAIVGETSLAVSRFQALAEREQAAILAKNEQLRADLLRSISHDLRTPLTSISGNADVLISDGAALSAEQRDKLARDIRSDAAWLNSTVENLLSITKLENGNVSLSFTAELLDDIIEEALRHVSPELTDHELSIETGDDVILVDADARLMVQVIVNLVNNAVTYTPAGSHIAIKTWTADGFAHCAVIDDGPGIDEADRAHIFDSFYTVNHGLADGHRSVGLGLSLCRSIIAAHNGTIQAEATVPHGCTFEFTLPLHALDMPEETLKGSHHAE